MSDPVACVIGWPVKHSRSPVIHRFWLNELGIAGDYVIHPVEPDRCETFLRDFAHSGFVGANVTVPYKQAAFAALSEADAAAKSVGAANTLWLEDGRLVGSNTDAYGFLANLDQDAAGWDAQPGTAIVLGAGGAARSVVWALLDRGFAPVHVVNRSTERAASLATLLGEHVIAHGWEDLPRLIGSASFLVNTTSLGMAGQPPLEIDLAPLPANAVVNDIVYIPIETPLLAAARIEGRRAVGGLGMLLHQAVPGFERWFGRRPTVTAALHQAVLESIRSN